jgi:hypothetical protein
MAASVVQAGPQLYVVSETGVPTQLTLPTGIVLRQDIAPRWVVFNNYVVLVNTPNQPLIIDSTGTVRLLSPKAPRVAPILSAVSGGALTGTYNGVRVTFVTTDAVGNIISESDYSPASGSQAVSSQFLKASNVDVSSDDVTFRRLYRPTNNGAVLFQWVDLNGNIQTTIQDDLADAGLPTNSAGLLGTPPRLTLCAEFRQRLFGVGDTDIDHVRFTQTGLQYSWPGQNLLAIPQVGSDVTGINAFIPRREALIVGRRNMLVQITGTGIEDATGTADFNVVILSRECGTESNETCKVYRDTGYFLWKDGVYTVSTNNITCISNGTPDSQDGKGNVRTWFVSDSYFNRAMFTQAFAVIDPNVPRYRLFLASAGSNVIDSFVDYDINDGTWWGPHKTNLFTPASGFLLYDANDRAFPIIGGADGNMYKEQVTRTDGASTAIVMDVVGKRHNAGEPDLEKYWGELSVLQKSYTLGTLQVISTAGDLTASSTIVQNCPQQKSRTRLGRLGKGKHVQLEIQNSEVGMDVELFGYEIDPVNLIGKR